MQNGEWKKDDTGTGSKSKIKYSNYMCDMCRRPLSENNVQAKDSSQKKRVFRNNVQVLRSTSHRMGRDGQMTNTTEGQLRGSRTNAKDKTLHEKDGGNRAKAKDHVLHEK